MTQDEVIRRLYQEDFASFVSLAFRMLHPGKELLHNWHLDYLMLCLMFCLKHGGTRAIINAPPRTLKSFLCSVAYAAFALACDPTLKILVVAGNRKLAQDLDNAARRLLRSPSIQLLFPHLRFDARRRQIHFEAGGQWTFGVYGTSIVGRGADVIIVDDPLSPAAAQDDAMREQANAWAKSDLLPRLNSKSKGVVLVVMQRLHHEDLTGMLLRSGEHWHHSVLEAIATTETTWPMLDGGRWARKKGEPLQPDVMSREELRDVMFDIGAVQFSAQYQQDPNIRSEYRTGQFTTEHYDDEWYRTWTPEKGIESSGFFGSVPEVSYLDYELFDGELPPQRPTTRLTQEQAEAAMMLHHQKLVASIRQDALDRAHREQRQSAAAIREKNHEA